MSRGVLAGVVEDEDGLGMLATGWCCETWRWKRSETLLVWRPWLLEVEGFSWEVRRLLIESWLYKTQMYASEHLAFG